MKKLIVILVLSFAVTALAQSNNYESHTANLSAVKIHYLKAGTGKKTLVLIHGFGDTSHMWIPLFDEFGKDFTIIAPDMRGLGESSRPMAGYDKKTIASDIHELVKSLGLEKINLLGHDIGLMVAYAYAAQYPNDVEKLALLEAPIPGIGEIWERSTRLRLFGISTSSTAQLPSNSSRVANASSSNTSGRHFRRIRKRSPKPTAGFTRNRMRRRAQCAQHLKCSRRLTLRMRQTTESLLPQNCRCRC